MKVNITSLKTTSMSLANVRLIQQSRSLMKIKKIFNLFGHYFW